MLEDVIDGYVSIDRATKDYGVVVREIDAELDESRSRGRNEERIAERASWLDADPAGWPAVTAVTVHDVIRQYGVVSTGHRWLLESQRDSSATACGLGRFTG